LDKQKCEQEIAQQKIEITKQGNTVEVVCVDMEIKLEQNNRKADLYNTVYQTSNNK
jgi:hypothetical protein